MPGCAWLEQPPAALAALLWSHAPQWTAHQVRQTLTASAHDLGPAGHDDETGYGLIGLPAAGLGAESGLPFTAATASPPSGQR